MKFRIGCWALNNSICKGAIWTAIAIFCVGCAGTSVSPVGFTMNPSYFIPPPGDKTIGDAHGDIAVAPDGKIYLSVLSGAHSGIQVYDAKGRYLRNVPGAPSDLHGFVLTKASDQHYYIFGARLDGQEIIQMNLDGGVVLKISAASIPDVYKTERDGKLRVSLTAVAVAPGGDIYAVDGYGRDFIHRFSKDGRYVGTFGGREAPWNFEQCHKIAIDTRYIPARLLCADRHHDRIVQMDLDGHVLGVIGQGFRWPSAMAIYKNELAVGELGGRVSVLDRDGHVVARIGTNENEKETKTNLVPPNQWLPDRFYAPHGVVYDSAGNLLVTEWNKWGRVSFVKRGSGHLVAYVAQARELPAPEDFLTHTVARDPNEIFTFNFRDVNGKQVFQQ